MTMTRSKQLALIRSSRFFDPDWYLKRYPDVSILKMDPAEHFLELGAILGRNPGPDFNTADYLKHMGEQIPQGLNPLVHAVIPDPGSKEERVEIFQPLDQDFLPAEAIINCWLRNPESVHDGLIELSQRLAAEGIRAVVVTHTQSLLDDPRIETLFSTFMVSRLDQFDDIEPGGCAPAWLQEVIHVEARRLNAHTEQLSDQRRDLIAQRATRAYCFWRSWLEAAKPRIFVAWGSSSPLSKLQLRLCKELDIPALVMERGHFSKTLSLEMLGQFAYGGGNLLPHSALNPAMSVSADDVEELISWVRECEEVPYQQWNTQLEKDDPISQARATSRRIVLFIGVNDLGSGVGYSAQDTSERHSLVYNSTADAFKNFKEALDRIDPDALLVFKPHPADKKTYGCEGDERLLICKDSNINELISIADLCVTLSTTALARCLVEGKPILLLALSEMSMKGIAYEVAHPTELAGKLVAALERDGFEARQRRGYAFLQHLFHSQLIGVSPEVPTRVRIPELARFIQQRIKHYTAPEARKLQSFGQTSFHPPVAVETKDPLRSGELARLAAVELTKAKSASVSQASESEGYESHELSGPHVVPQALRRAVDVVIPIYGDEGATAACIDSVLSSRGQVDFRVILIDDCSPVQEMAALLDRVEQVPNVIRLSNPRNLGFPATANRGLSYDEQRDVVLLNSDTIVAPGWLEGLRDAAYSNAIVATATPMSNNAGLFSLLYPDELSFDGRVETIARWSTQAAERNKVALEVLTGHGFCLYLRRSALDRVGLFDQITYWPGYYEEIDWCARASDLGYRHVCATNVVVGHMGGASFGAAAEELQRAHRETFRQRYPEYFPRRRRFNAMKILDPYRFDPR